MAARRRSASRERSRVASGQAAETLGILTLCESGDHLVSSPSLYGGTYNLFHYTLPKLGINVTFVDDPHDLSQWEAAIQDNTKLFFGETMPNPKNDVFDIEGVSGVAHANGIPLMLDNTVPTPYLIRPFEWGCDIVVHSLTKFIGGHGTSIGGAIDRRWHVRLRRVRPVPELHRSRPELSRPRLLAGPRARFVHPQGARPAPARHGHVDLAA